MDHEIPIPHCFVGMTKMYTAKETMFKNYLLGYMAVSFPEFKPIQIDTKKMVVICEKSRVVTKK